MYLLWHPFGWDWRQWLGWQGKLWVRRPQTPDHTPRAYILSSQPRGGRMGPEIDQRNHDILFPILLYSLLFWNDKIDICANKKKILGGMNLIELTYWTYILWRNHGQCTWYPWLLIIDIPHWTYFFWAKGGLQKATFWKKREDKKLQTQGNTQ